MKKSMKNGKEKAPVKAKKKREKTCWKKPMKNVKVMGKEEEEADVEMIRIEEEEQTGEETEEETEAE